MFNNKNLLRRDKRYISDDFSILGCTLTPRIDRKGNIYKNEDVPEKIGFTIESEGYVRIEYTITGPWEKEICRGVLETQGKQEQDIIIPDISEVYGVFLIELCGYDEQGEYIGKDHITFSHVRVSNDCWFKKSGVGVHMYRHDYWATYDCVDIIKDLGVRMIRDDLSWDWFETEKGKINVPECYTNTVNRFLDEGIETNVIFDYGNPFYDEGKLPYTDEGIAAYARYIIATLDHYKGRIKRCEIWNEYNLWKGSIPECYVEMLKVAYTAIKEKYPYVTVTAGVTCSAHTEWIRRIFEAGAYDYCDEVSLHPYATGPDSAYPDDRQGQAELNAKSYIDVIKEYGPEKPVWISEMGWSTCVKEGMVTREDQAACIARLFAITETSDILSRTIMYDLRDDSRNPFEIEYHWGLIEAESSKVPHAAKESYAAVSCLNQMTSFKDQLGVEEVYDLRIAHFAEKKGETQLIWSYEGPQRVIFKAKGEVIFTDMYGNKSVLVPRNGEISIVVNENPIYVTGEINFESAEIIPYENKDQSYTITLIPEKREEGWYLKLKLNSWQNMLYGNVRFDIPELEASINYSEFKLNKGESLIAEAFVGNPDFYKTYRVLTDVLLADGQRFVEYENVSFAELPYKGEKPLSFILNAPENYRKVTDTPIPELKAEVSLSYDEEYFYLEAIVHDKSHLQHGLTGNTWQDIWDGDCIQFCLQPLNDGNKKITRFSDFGIAKTSNTKEDIVWRWRTLQNRTYGRYRGTVPEITRTYDKTIYKVKFLWSELITSGVTLKDCDVFGFALRVCYADSSPSTIDGYMQLYGGIGSWRSPLLYQPSEFGTLVLGKKD